MIEGTLLQYMLTLSRGAAARQRGIYVFDCAQGEKRGCIYIYFKLLYIIIYNNSI
jgi:hypothetical protein